MQFGKDEKAILVTRIGLGDDFHQASGMNHNTMWKLIFLPRERKRLYHPACFRRAVGIDNEIFKDV